MDIYIVPVHKAGTWNKVIKVVSCPSEKAALLSVEATRQFLLSVFIPVSSLTSPLPHIDKDTRNGT